MNKEVELKSRKVTCPQGKKSVTGIMGLRSILKKIFLINLFQDYFFYSLYKKEMKIGGKKNKEEEKKNN